MSKYFKDALEKVSKETKEKIAKYLDFIELCVVQKSLRDEGYLLTISTEFVDSDSLYYCFELRYENKESKRLCNRMTNYYSLSQSEGYWSTYEEALTEGINYILKIKENETEKRNEIQHQ